MKRLARLLWLLLPASLAVALFASRTPIRSEVLRALGRPGGREAPPESLPSVESQARGLVCLGFVDLEFGVASLQPLQPGRVAEVLVHEGQSVPSGAVLIKLDDRAALLRVAEARAALGAANAQLTEAADLPEKNKTRILMQQEAVGAVRHQLSAARYLLDDKRTQARFKEATTSQVAAAEEQIKQLEAEERAQLAKLDEAKRYEPAAELHRVEAEVAIRSVTLQQAELALAECRLTAPQAGTVLRILVGPGDILTGQPSRPTLLFAPDGPRLIRAEVEQEFVDRVAIGQTARIHDDASSDVEWTGQVVRISDWYTQRRTIMQETAQFNDVRTVECVIQLNPNPAPMKIGQRVRIHLDPLAGHTGRPPTSSPGR